MLIDGFISAAQGGVPERVPLFWWQGYSMNYHLTSVFGLANLDCREPGVFLVVRREPDDKVTPLFAGIGGSISDDLVDDFGEHYLRAIAAGANEVHVSLTAETNEARLALLEDIARGWGFLPVDAEVAMYA